MAGKELNLDTKMEKLLNSETGDITVITENGQIKVHQHILEHNSEIYEKIFKENTEKILEYKEYLTSVVYNFMYYLYTNKMQMTTYDTINDNIRNAFKLLRLSEVHSQLKYSEFIKNAIIDFVKNSDESEILVLYELELEFNLSNRRIRIEIIRDIRESLDWKFFLENKTQLLMRKTRERFAIVKNKDEKEIKDKKLILIDRLLENIACYDQVFSVNFSKSLRASSKNGYIPDTISDLANLQNAIKAAPDIEKHADCVFTSITYPEKKIENVFRWGQTQLSLLNARISGVYILTTKIEENRASIIIFINTEFIMNLLK